MKYLKKYERFLDEPEYDLEYEFYEDEYVKITDDAINNLLEDIKNNKDNYLKHFTELTFDDIKNKTFYIEEVDYQMVGPNDTITPYNVENLDEEDQSNFYWGWTDGSDIRRLTPEEEKELKIKLDSKKYNI